MYRIEEMKWSLINMCFLPSYGTRDLMTCRRALQYKAAVENISFHNQSYYCINQCFNFLHPSTASTTFNLCFYADLNLSGVMKKHHLLKHYSPGLFLSICWKNWVSCLIISVKWLQREIASETDEVMQHSVEAWVLLFLIFEFSSCKESEQANS